MIRFVDAEISDEVDTVGAENGLEEEEEEDEVAEEVEEDEIGFEIADVDDAEGFNSLDGFLVDIHSEDEDKAAPTVDFFSDFLSVKLKGAGSEGAGSEGAGSAGAFGIVGSSESVEAPDGATEDKDTVGSGVADDGFKGRGSD